MAATQTVPQLPSSRKSPIGKSGVLTLSGFGIRVRVQNGHLEIEDGVGLERRKLKLPRVGHGLQRLVVIGSDGMISLAALRWLAVQGAAFLMLNRDGSVLATTGPVRPSDARLRRAQALAYQSGAALRIARELICQKLSGQERVARDKLHDTATAQAIADYLLDLAEADTLDRVRSLESKGAAAYWAAWKNVQVTFPKNDLPRIPIHWRTFGTRKSPLSGSPRLAVTPANAMLNYLYALLESEARLAAAALGLDPGLGFIHVDTPARDSLACDLMEPVRPQVDAYVLDWITRQPLKREWFFEQRDGQLQALMAPFACQLAETGHRPDRRTLGRVDGRQLWSKQRASGTVGPPTRSTQSRKRRAKGIVADPDGQARQTPARCRPDLRQRSAEEVTVRVAVAAATEHIKQVARGALGRAQGPESLAKQAEAQRQRRGSKRLGQHRLSPERLTENVYRHFIQPALASRTIPPSPPASVCRAARRVGFARVSSARIRGIGRRWQRLLTFRSQGRSQLTFVTIASSTHQPKQNRTCRHVGTKTTSVPCRLLVRTADSACKAFPNLDAARIVDFLRCEPRSASLGKNFSRIRSHLWRSKSVCDSDHFKALC